MEKTIRVCTLENQVESDVICSILRENKIPFSLVKMEDSAYDGLYVSHGPWGYIEAPLPYADSILQIVKDVRETRSDGNPPRGTIEKRGGGLLSIVQVAVPVVLAIAVAVLVVIDVHLNRRLDESTASNKLISWNWEPLAKVMTGRLRSTGRLVCRYYDRNYNGIFEESAMYSPDGSRVVTYRDTNEDGYNEQYETRSANGALLTVAYDLNANCVFEREVDYYSATDFVEYLNTVDSGLFDKAIVHKDGRQRTIDLRETLFADQP